MRDRSMLGNQKLNQTLPPASKGNPASIECYLLEYDVDPRKQQRVWTYQYNPQALKFRNSADYAESKTLSTTVPDQQFSSTAGKTLQIANILLDSYCLGKSLLPIMDGIEELLKAKADKQQYSPKVLTFIFGTRKFSPCVLTECSWDETAWLSGAPARAEMSLSFKEVPIDRKTADLSLTPVSKPIDKKDGSPRISLTPRQRADASTKAIANLAKVDVTKLSATIQGILRSKSYKLSTDATTGDVVMLDSKGAKLGAIGRYDSKNLDTSDQFFTLPKK